MYNREHTARIREEISALFELPRLTKKSTVVDMSDNMAKLFASISTEMTLQPTGVPLWRL